MECACSNPELRNPKGLHVRIASLCAFLWLGCAAAFAQDNAVSRENQLKAAVLHKFYNYVQWDEAPFRPAQEICIVGQNPFGTALERLSAEAKPNSARVLAVRTVASPSQAASCAIVFISRSESEQLASVLESLGATPLITVSDIPGFALAGGVIELTVDKGRIRFIINNDAAQAHHVKISSSLLKLASEVLGQRSLGRMFWTLTV